MSQSLEPSLIGTVQDVNGSTIRIELRPETVTGLSFVNGESYRVGQIGSFVRIPLGFVNLYGVVSQVGAGAAPAPKGDELPNPYGNRWLLAQLVGEGRRGGRFERGLSQHPTIDDPAHIVTEADLRLIYGHGDLQDYVSVGRLASAESIPTLVDINKLITRHSAVVGTTGSGKSTTVSGLLHSISDPNNYPSSRIVIFDIHGEYAKALKGRCIVYRVGSRFEGNERPLHIPYWALTSEEIIAMAFGKMDDSKTSLVTEKIVALKRESLEKKSRDGVSVDTVTADTPVPYSIHKLWFELHKREHQTVVPVPGSNNEERIPAYVLNEDGNPLDVGDALSVRPPIYRTVKTSGTPAERVQYGGEAIGIRQQLGSLATKLRDPRLSFLFNPGDLCPDIEGSVNKELDTLLENWIGESEPITILDLSGVPSSVLTDLIGALIRILYDAIFWSRNLPEGGRQRPLLLVLEEAHTYLNTSHSNFASDIVKRIAKEGRKYGVGLMVVSQRPSEIDTTILSQCGTIFALRLSNDIDRGHVSSSASDNLKGLFDMLPILRTGEAIIVGEAVNLPVRTLIDPPPKNRRPDSADPRVVRRGGIGPQDDGFDGPAGWNQIRDRPQNYLEVVKLWRLQNSKPENTNANYTMEMIPVTSSNISAIGYDPDSQTLRIEFINGGSYDYFDVPEQEFECLRNAPSHGQYLAQSIKGAYRYMRV